MEVVLYPIGLVIATPLFIHHLGIDQYGVWVLANSIIASIGVLNVGLAEATIKYVSKYKALNNTGAIYKVVQSSYTIYLGLSVLLVSIGMVIGYVIGEVQWFEITPVTRELMRYIVPIGCITLSIKFIEQVFTATFKGFERYDISAQLLMISKGAILVSNVILVVMGFSLVYVFLFTAVISALMLLVEAFFVKRYVPQFGFTPRLDVKIAKEVVGFGIWSWLQLGFSMGVSQLDKFIVASFAGVKTLAFYSLGFMVYSQLHNVFTACSNWLFPFFSTKIAKNENVTHIYHQARGILLIAALSIILVLYLVKDLIFPLWLGQETYRESEFYILGFMAFEALIVLSVIPYYFLSGSGRPKLNAFMEIILKSLNMICMLIFFYLFDINGIIYGLLFSVILFIPFQDFIIYSRIFSERHLLKNVSLLFPSLVLVLILLVDRYPWKYLLLLPLPWMMKYLFFNELKINWRGR